MKLSAFVKSVVLVFTCFFLLFFTSTRAFAETKTTQTAATTAASTNPNVPNNLHNWTQSVMLEVMSSLSCQLTGIDPTTASKQCLGFDQKTGKIGFLPAADPKKGQMGGAIGGVSNMISALYTPPLHTSDYFQNLAQNFGITKQTYAQRTGVGFDSLSPLMKIWTDFRNIVYLFLIVIFVIIGLAIMLRVKIDPRTVMTVQNQIPKIIVGILLVTFSFAIAGFLIDMMWVSTYFVINTLTKTTTQQAGQAKPTDLIEGSPFKIIDVYGGFDKLTFPPAEAGKKLIKNVLEIKSDPSNYIPFIKLSPILSNTVDSIADPNYGKTLVQKIAADPTHIFTIFALPSSFLQGKPVNYLIDVASLLGSTFVFNGVMHWNFPEVFGFDPGFVGQALIAGGISTAMYPIFELFIRETLPWIIVWLIITIALLAALFRLWFTLLMAYISILLDIVLAPFWIIGGILPGSQISFGGWLKDIGANLLAFPAAIFMLLIGKVFMEGFASASNSFVPPLIGDVAKPEMFSSIIGIGVILITPNIVNMLKQALKAPKMESGIGKAFGPGLAGPNRLVQFGLTSATMEESKTSPGFMIYRQGLLGTVGKMLGVRPH